MSIVIEKPTLETVQVCMIGDSPLICHAWSQKAKQEMLAKQMKQANKAKEAKNPEQDFLDSLYPMPDGSPTEYGFPAVAFKSAAVAACRVIDGLKMTEVRAMFHIDMELVPIFGEPTPREDMVRLGGKTADIRYRGQFDPWYTVFPIKYNADAVSLEQVLNLIEIGGFSNGVGEWRPERNGQFGRFHIANSEEIQALGIDVQAAA